MRDALTMCWKEWRELLDTMNLKSGGMRMLVFLGVFSVFLPLQAGKSWLASPMVLFYDLWLPLLFVSSLTANAFAGERERHTLETLLASRLSDRAILLGKTLAGVAYGWGLALALMAVSLVSANLASRGPFVFYRPELAWGGPLLSLLGASMASGAGILVSLRAPTLRQAQQTLSLVNLALFLVPAIGSQFLPAELRARMAISLSGLNMRQLILLLAGCLLLLDMALFAVAGARFKRARLILD